MRYFIVEISEDDFPPEMCKQNLREALYHGLPTKHEIREIPEVTHRADGTERMTFAQREKLWSLCGGYNVPFRENDYCPTQFSEKAPIMYEGWVGGISDPQKTIYVAVEPNGRSHS